MQSIYFPFGRTKNENEKKITTFSVSMHAPIYLLTAASTSMRNHNGQLIASQGLLLLLDCFITMRCHVAKFSQPRKSTIPTNALCIAHRTNRNFFPFFIHYSSSSLFFFGVLSSPIILHHCHVYSVIYTHRLGACSVPNEK